MARHESDREDLLAEATALVTRVELNVVGFESPVVVGFRRGGQASVYFGQDCAYHFNAANELRRAFVDDLLFRADGGRLASLRRQRGGPETELVRHDLTDEEQQAFVATADENLRQLKQAISHQQFDILRQVSPEDAMPAVATWLGSLFDKIAIARNPRVG